MVLEMLLNPMRAERSPWELLFLGAVYSSIGIFLAMLIFSDYVGLVMVFLTTLACTYLVQGTLKLEEKRDIANILGERFLLKEHGRALSVFMFLFVGFVIAFSFWYVVLPADTVHNIFGIQEATINAINAPQVTGNVTSASAFLAKIFVNNVKVLLFTLVFALFYGAGAVFILVWNAAVVGTAVGMFSRNYVAQATAQIGLVGVSHYFSSYSLGLMRYLTHGVFEILAYFMAALAGGIISIAIARHEFNSPNFRKVLFDSADLIVLSIAVLFLAALVEVYVTPAFF